MKRLCERYEIPTAPFRIFDDAAAAADYVRRAGRPLVIKADGLAAGKGVVVAQSSDEACAALEAMMVSRRFGDAGARVVVEEMLRGRRGERVCDLRRHPPRAAPARAGSQAPAGRRPRAQHGRDGCRGAGPGGRGRGGRPDRRRDPRPDAVGDGPGRTPVPGRAVRRGHADARRPPRARVQRAVRRSRGAGAARRCSSPGRSSSSRPPSADAWTGSRPALAARLRGVRRAVRRRAIRTSPAPARRFSGSIGSTRTTRSCFTRARRCGTGGR